MTSNYFAVTPYQPFTNSIFSSGEIPEDIKDNMHENVSYKENCTAVLMQDSPKPFKETPLRLLVACFVFIENLIVAVALLRSWKKLRQNLYIFALSIAICDTLLGLTHFLVGVITSYVTFPQASINEVNPTMSALSWFYTIRAAALLMTEVASVLNAALIALAFETYVVTLAPSHGEENGTNKLQATIRKRMKGSNKSQLLSRKTSYVMTGIVWGVSIVIGIIPMFLNCGEDCACFIEHGIMGEDSRARSCFEEHSCSYLFPPLKNGYNLFVICIFFFGLLVMTVSSFRVMIAAGGISALLPYKLHKKYLQRRKSREEVEQLRIHRRLRSHSVQMSYMRNMMHFMFLLTLTYIVLRIPGNVLLLVESLTTYQLNISPTGAQVIVIMGICNSLINPIIFATTLHGMRDALKELFAPCCMQVVVTSIGQQVYSDSANQYHSNHGNDDDKQKSSPV